MSRLRPGSRLLTMLMAGLLAIGCWQLGEGSWIYAKAGLAQFLLQRAWCRALAGEAMPKPWPWADTWPVARLRMQHPSVDLIVLAGAYGRTLAFGPGHVTSSALPWRHTPSAMRSPRCTIESLTSESWIRDGSSFRQGKTHRIWCW